MRVKSGIRAVSLFLLPGSRWRLVLNRRQDNAAAEMGSILLRVKTNILSTCLSCYHIITILTCPLFTKPLVKSCKKSFRIPSLNICWISAAVVVNKCAPISIFFHCFFTSWMMERERTSKERPCQAIRTTESDGSWHKMHTLDGCKCSHSSRLSWNFHFVEFLLKALAELELVWSVPRSWLLLKTNSYIIHALILALGWIRLTSETREWTCSCAIKYSHF